MNNLDLSQVVFVSSYQLVAFAFLVAFSVICFDRWLDIIVKKLKKLYRSRHQKDHLDH